MTVLIVPDAMAPDLRRYAAYNGRIYTKKIVPLKRLQIIRSA